jgi:hypothetical protein
MAMIGYMRSSQNDELKNLLRQGAQILSAKSISELFVKNANLQHIQKALRAQFIMQSSSEIDSLTLAFRKILMIMAEAFEYTYRKSIYKDLTDEDLALIGFTDEMTNFILKLFSKSTSKLIPEPSNHDDNEYIQAYPLFYGKNRLSFNCISAILASYPPDFFIRHAVENKNSYQNWIFSLVQWMLDCRDICEGHALREWVEQLPDIKEGPEGKKLIALYGNIALGFCYFLSNNGYLPEILGHEKIFHLTEKIKSEFRGNSYYEKIIEEFENSHKK